MLGYWTWNVILKFHSLLDLFSYVHNIIYLLLWRWCVVYKRISFFYNIIVFRVSVVTREYPNYWRGLMLIVVVDVAVMVVTGADGDRRRLGCAEGSYLSPPTVSFGVFAHTRACLILLLLWGRGNQKSFVESTYTKNNRHVYRVR